jgi:hypothetical protein
MDVTLPFPLLCSLGLAGALIILPSILMDKPLT